VAAATAPAAANDAKKQLSKRSDELICINILTLEMSGVDRRPAKEGEEVGVN